MQAAPWHWIDGTSAGTSYDQIVVNGAVDVSGATLTVNHGYAAGNGEIYKVILNDAADAITVPSVASVRAAPSTRRAMAPS